MSNQDTSHGADVSALDVLSGAGDADARNEPSAFASSRHEHDDDDDPAGEPPIDVHPVPKRKGPNKAVIYAVAGFMVLIIGGVGYAVFSKLFAKAPPAPVPASVGVVEPAAPGDPAPSLDQPPLTAADAEVARLMAASGSPASGVLADPVGQVAQQPMSPAQQAVAAAAVPTIATASAPAPAAAALPAKPGVEPARVEAVEGRVTRLEEDVAILKNSYAAKPSQARPARAAAAATGERHAAAPKSKQPPRAAAGKKSEGKGEVEVAASQPQVAPVADAAGDRSKADKNAGISGLRLRGVYPPTGENRVAWVLDGEVFRVVKAGSTIRGARVTAVDANRVVTDQGEIR